MGFSPAVNVTATSGQKQSFFWNSSYAGIALDFNGA
jgi:hypothetical protein